MAAPASRWSESAILGGALVVAAFLVAFGALHYGFYTRNLLLDTPLYERYGDAIVHGGKLPYRDFGLEYPPGALVVFAAPSLIAPAGDFVLYARLFEALMLLCGVVASALVVFILLRQGAGSLRLAAGTLLAGLAPLALGPVVLSRFDLWPAVLTVAALAALVAGRRGSAFVLLGAGTAVKIYPLVLVPLALAYVWRRDGRRAAARAAAVFAAAAAACLAPFLVASPGGVWASISGQLGRPLQIESLGASFLLAAHQLWGLSLSEVSSHGSDNLAGSGPQALALAQSLLALALLGALWVAFARGEASRDRLLRYAAAAVCAFVALNKVLSPQYLIWLFALVPLVRGRRGAAAGAFFVAAMLLTQLWFPRDYINLVYGLDPRASWFVLARDLTLLALLATLAWPQRRARRLGVGLVSALAALAAAAAVAGASSSRAAVATHSGLLVQSGVPSRCGVPRPAPTLSAGSAAYEAFALSSPPHGGGCVRVELSTRPGVEVFGAAYRQGFEPADPRANWLGDAGSCTNVPGLSGRRLRYSFPLRPGARFTLEFESCAAGDRVASYLALVHDGARAQTAFRSAVAGEHAGVVTVRWQTTREPARASFALYRDENGVAVAVPGGTRRGHGPRGGSYTFLDRRPPLLRPLRYWILALDPAGGWTLEGPLTAAG